MKKIEVKKLNRTSDDIWQLLSESVKNKNWAILVQNLNRMHALQGYYCKLLTIQSGEIELLKVEERFLTSKLTEYEKDELISLTKQNGTYQTFKARIDELFQEN